MRYEDRIVCFLDVLGFAEHIRETVNADGNDNESRIAMLAGAFEAVRDLLDIDKPEERKGKEVTQFSDSIVISFPMKEESGVFYALLEILWVQIDLLYRGMLCRGAVTKGKLIHTPRILFGPAMVDAYRLESNAATYPRVILDESIVEAGATAHARHHRAEHERESILELLLRDSDGMYFINYVTGAQSELNDPECDYPSYLAALRDIIAKGLENRDPAVRVKYQWLRERFQPHLTRVKTRAAESESDHDLQLAYLSIHDLEPGS
jgi:hypothetical protein